MKSDQKTVSEFVLKWLNRFLAFGIFWFLLTLVLTYLGIHLWGWLFVPDGEYMAEFTPANIGLVTSITLAPIGALIVLRALRGILLGHPNASLFALVFGGGALALSIWRFILSPPLPS